MRARAIAWAGAFAAIGCAAIACNAILGNEPLELDPGDAGADETSISDAARADAGDGGGSRDAASDVVSPLDAPLDAAPADAADAATACDAQCAPAPPPGWSGPVALFEGTVSADGGAARPSCPADFPSNSYDGNNGLVAPPAVCSACTCAAPTGTECSVSTSLYDNNCGNGFCGNWVLASGVCTDMANVSTCTSLAPHVATAAPVGVGGACAAPAQVPAIAPAAFAGAARACATAAAPVQASCPASELCIDAPQAPFLDRWCVQQTGDMPCPAGAYGEKHLEFGAIDDTRGCGDCGCDPPAGRVCAAGIDIYGASCGGSPNNVVGTPACFAGPLFSSDHRYAYWGSASGGTCAPRGGQPRGAASGAQPTTFCCQGGAADAGADAPGDAGPGDAARPPDPGTISPTLQLWVTADRGLTCDASHRVTAWADQSGHGRDATAVGHLGPQCQQGPSHALARVDLPYFSDPLPGNAPYSDDTLDVDLTFLSGLTGYTMFVVERRWADPGTVAEAAVLGSLLPDETNWNFCGQRPAGKVEDNQAIEIGYFRRADQAMSFGAYYVCRSDYVLVGSVSADAGPFPPSFDMHRFSTTGGHEIWVNGSSVGTSADLAVLGMSGNGAIGRGQTLQLDSRFHGDIAEVIVYGSTLSDVDRAQVEAYLQDHWAL